MFAGDEDGIISRPDFLRVYVHTFISVFHLTGGDPHTVLMIRLRREGVFETIQEAEVIDILSKLDTKFKDNSLSVVSLLRFVEGRNNDEHEFPMERGIPGSDESKEKETDYEFSTVLVSNAFSTVYRGLMKYSHRILSN